MLAYSTVGTNRLEEALQFYDRLLPLIGLEKLFDNPRGGRVYGANGTMFGVILPFDEQAAVPGNGTMSGFALESREQVDLFHAKVLELGGRSEGEPGLRGPADMHAYFAYVRDLDGNKLCAFRFGPD